MATASSTSITVRVQAKGGKFLADDIGGSDLSRRIELDGPDDELKELADTFDDMLERLQRAFTAQQRFVGNASHELRTPVSAITGYAQLLATSWDDLSPEEQLNEIDIDLEGDPDSLKVLLNDRDVTERIRSDDVTAMSSIISSISGVSSSIETPIARSFKLAISWSTSAGKTCTPAGSVPLFLTRYSADNA